MNTHTKPSSSGLRVSETFGAERYEDCTGSKVRVDRGETILLDGFGAERYEDCAGNRAEAVRGRSHDC